MDMKKILQVVTEGANPHKVALPVQMAMQHFQQPKTPVVKKETTMHKYFKEAEESFIQQQVERKQLLKQYAQKVSQRVLENSSRKQTIEGVMSDIWTGVKDFTGNLNPQDIAKEQSPRGEMMRKLLAYKADPRYANPETQKQIDQRITTLLDRINVTGTIPGDAQGNPKQVVPPEQFNTKQLR